ncbi:sucrose phosphorylase [Clostridium pasteurianum]|uniref:Sucrose 6(F)-phosphate phosphorylase n=1 Tax=Clostridium pasteurianum BC1 TaxID=86416 RepID=R4K7X6_CLOPA|nr:sucrose phosphorylase [Clostridium pasteurianum]AGK98653.1 sucrose phosphorylase [Clostridium pasteurianum BC1]
MAIKNKIMLITYADSLGKNLKELENVLTTYFKNAVGGVHILPFFPSSADRGFAPMNYEKVDSAFGDWQDIEKLSENFYLMYDFMINHISRNSEYFKDFQENKDKSPYADFFIRYKDFWPKGEPSQEDVDLIYKRKPRAPYIDVNFEDGTSEKIWCTFDSEQVDLNIKSEVTKKFIKDTLTNMAKRNASLIRLDAFAYATKKVGTNCFFIEPDTWELLDEVKEILEPLNVDILPEIHEHYSIQMKISEKGHWIYDFALPMIMLHALYSGVNKNLIKWLKMSPKKQFTTLDTHDGIGVVDVKDLLTDEEVEITRESLFTKGANVKKIYNTTAYNNLDIYQVNCTYYSALGNNDDAYTLARAIQFFAPGIPQVYYVGLMAGENDIKLLEETKVGRNINRHYYSKEEVEENMKRPVMKRLLKLMEFRNSYAAFNGDYFISDINEAEVIEITWEKDEFKTTLKANLKTHKFTIGYFDVETKEFKELAEV